MKAGASPIPVGVGGSVCGHSKCGVACNVRYVGHTSRIVDHHTFHMARAVANIWAAAIVVGLAVVLTGAVAYTSIEAKSISEQKREQKMSDGDWTRVSVRLEQMQKELMGVKALCASRAVNETVVNVPAEPKQ